MQPVHDLIDIAMLAGNKIMVILRSLVLAHYRRVICIKDICNMYMVIQLQKKDKEKAHLCVPIIGGLMHTAFFVISDQV